MMQIPIIEINDDDDDDDDDDDERTYMLILMMQISTREIHSSSHERT